MNYNQSEAASFLHDYSSQVAENLMRTQFDVLAKIAGLILSTKSSGKRIYTAGNGGSAATASHMCNDLVKGARVHGREGFRAMCLNDSTPIVTCLANDFSYEDIYAIQLRTYAEPGDLLIVFSGSGNSPNIVKGLQVAKEMGLTTIGFGGRDGGKMKTYCDEILIAPTNSMEQLEDMHMLYEHALVSLMQKILPTNFDIEVFKYPESGRKFKAAFFDYDGTVAAVRAGWQDAVAKCACATLAEIPGVSKEEVEPIVRAYIEQETGRPMIAVGERIAEEVSKRGGTPRQPIDYKLQYDAELDKLVTSKLAGLGATKTAEDVLIPGVLQFLKLLKANGIALCLASGTDEKRLKSECDTLGLTELFDLGVYGAREDGVPCEKDYIVKNLLNKNGWTGRELVGFGDGGFDIRAIKDVGGYAVGLATNEAERVGVNDHKRGVLIDAGSDAIIPDFSDPEKLWRFLNR
ncbi:MAG: SIS domain-containing protein [Thermoguttaceae bacterium]|jgi:phosphoheptose isomerase/phosphoglycolate phosphatase-like HAD superfamily hydrolase